MMAKLTLTVAVPRHGGGIVSLPKFLNAELDDALLRVFKQEGVFL